MINVAQLFETDGLFRTTYPEGQSFAWRLLTIKEFNILRGLRDVGILSQHSVYLEAFKRCYFGEFHLLQSNIPIGMLISVGQLIMYLSGDCELDTLKEDIEVARALYPAQSVNERMKQVVWAAFPSYKIEDLDQWTRPQLIYRFVLSEQVLLSRGLEYKPLDITEIKLPGEIEEAAPRQHAVDTSKLDFAAAAEAQRKEIGFWAVEDAKELELQRSQPKLTTAQARKLDRMKAAGR